jgi:uncharacterized protein (UPF0548 family)
MKLRIGWGDLTSAAARAVDLPATATGSELRGSSNGLRRERHRAELHGAAFPEAARELLAFRWFPQGFLRAEVGPDGRSIMQRCRIGPVTVDAPVRVVERVEEPRRVAVTVVTLAGHPERGVERYELVHDSALARATLTVTKAWELADPLARLAGPFSTWLQAYATRVSLRRFRHGRW